MPYSVEEALAALDDLVQYFEQHADAEVQERAAVLLRSVDVVHRVGLGRIAALLRDAGLERRALDDPAVALLFDLYDLGEGGERERADAVLDAVRPYVESHGGRLEVVEAQGGAVRVRLSGACQGCAGSAATLRHIVEATLRDGLPGFVRMEVVEPPPPSNFIPLSAIEKRPRLGWHAALRADEVPPGTVRGLDVAGERVLVANVGGELYAYRNACPGTPLPLDAGRVRDGALLCPWHGCRFDLRGGKRLAGSGPGLGVVPVAVESGQVKIGVLAREA